jgi:hypothetical protein
MFLKKKNLVTQNHTIKWWFQWKEKRTWGKKVSISITNLVFPQDRFGFLMALNAYLGLAECLKH